MSHPDLGGYHDFAIAFGPVGTTLFICAIVKKQSGIKPFMRSHFSVAALADLLPK
jgi:hypothetical protein